jgi:hypothetical protein
MVLGLMYSLRGDCRADRAMVLKTCPKSEHHLRRSQSEIDKAVGFPLVRCRMLHVIDDEQVYRIIARFQLHPELILQRREEGRATFDP